MNCQIDIKIKENNNIIDSTNIHSFTVKLLLNFISIYLIKSESYGVFGINCKKFYMEFKILKNLDIFIVIIYKSN